MQTRPLNPDETPSSISRNGYNAHAQAYLNWTSSLPSPRLAWLDKLFSSLDPTTLPTAGVLELGCGAGVPITLKLASTVGHVTAVDISATQLSLAKQHLAAADEHHEPRPTDADEPTPTLSDKVTLIESDVLTLTFPPSTFHAIVSFYTLIHLPPPSQITLLRRAYDWLKSGGCFVFNVSVTESEGEVGEGWNGMDAYWAGLGRERTMEVLREVGFEVLREEVVKVEEVEGVEGDPDFLWVVVRKGGGGNE